MVDDRQGFRVRIVEGIMGGTMVDDRLRFRMCVVVAIVEGWESRLWLTSCLYPCPGDGGVGVLIHHCCRNGGDGTNERSSMDGNQGGRNC